MFKVKMTPGVASFVFYFHRKNKCQQCDIKPGINFAGKKLYTALNTYV